MAEHMFEGDGWSNGPTSRGVQSQKQIADKAAQRLPSDAAARKRIPIARGVMDYFPAALAAVAEVSVIGNEQHNPGEPLHWARSKSTDHADCIARHLIERGTIDVDGARHSAKLAWRALALLQTELEEEAEDEADLRDARAALAENGDAPLIPHEEVKRRLGLDDEPSRHTEPVQIGGAVHMMPTPEEVLKRIQRMEGGHDRP